MSIYKGDTKVTGTGVQIDDTLSSTSTHAVTNSAITNALIDVGYSEWVKPQDWIDIENGAKENNIYFLVGHPADYSKYAKFSFRVEPEDRGTYDVYVDGQKIVSAANNWTTTTIDFQSLNLSTGFDVTHPEALRTHIVRVCASTIGQSITRIQTQSVSGQVNQGVLWAHFQLSNACGIDSLFGSESSKKFPILEAITAQGNKITYTVNSVGSTSGLYQSFSYCTSLVQIPVLEANSRQYSSGGYLSFLNVPCKKVVIRNNNGNESLGMFNQFKGQEIDVENGIVFGSALQNFTDFHNMTNLKKLPVSSTTLGQNLQAYGFSKLEPTFIDDGNDTSRKTFRFYGFSYWKTTALKGLVVSNQAPFDGGSPQINISYTGLDRQALVNLFNSLPTVSASQVCNITGATGASALTADDLAIATAKGWTITR